MRAPLIEFESVSVCKSNHVLLDKVSFQVLQNEFVGIIGPNGAGKTTLLNVVAGFEKFEGNIRLFGRSETWKRSRETRVRIAYVPQSFEIDPSFPILAMEAVMMGSYGRRGIFRNPGEPERRRALELMELMRIDHLIRRPLGHLSGGERQKISLARALLQHPEILLLDEPTLNLDIAVQAEVMNLIAGLYEREAITILYVTHDFNLLPKCMGRVVAMNHGRIMFDGAADRALTGTTLSRVFEYPLETFEQNGRRFISLD